MSWGVDGWLISNFLAKISPAAAQALRQRISSELTTTFASHYVGEISLAQVLDLKTMEIYRKSPTGQKYLVNPSKDV
jgi:NADPH2:quinone reductase